jgi:L-malate glycosyltransferase
VSTRPHVVMLGGHLTFVQDWAAAAAGPADVTLLHSQKASLEDMRSIGAAGGYATAGLRHVGLRPGRSLRPVNDVLNARALRQVISSIAKRNRAVSHLHTHFYAGSHVATRVARALGIKLVHTEHSSAILTGRISAPGRAILHEVCDEASTVFAVSPQLADAMRELGIDREIVVVPNPVDTAVFSEQPVRAHYPPAEGRWEFSTIGWLVPRKNHATVIRAFALVRGRLPGSGLTIIGEGALQQDLVRLAGSLGVEPHVRFLGRCSRPQIADVLAGSHVYVHASEAETFGVALVEAWASGLPVVTVDCGGVSPLADTIGGEAVPGLDPERLATAMLAAVDGASLEERARIRIRSLRHFDRRSVVEQLRAAYT